MSNKKTAARLLCESYVQRYPDMKKLTLARKVFNDNVRNFPELKSIEHTRKCYINVITGSNGERSRDFGDKALQVPLTKNTTNQKPYKEDVNTGARVLILDIETAPLRAYVWNVWQQNVSPDQIESDWFVLTWAAKWLFEDKVYSGKITPKEVIKEDDRRIIKGIWELVNKADIIIAHNGEKFDMPKLNTRFLMHGLVPPLPYQTIDTLKHIRRQFGFVHNKLDYVNKRLHLRRKVEHEGFPLWVSCMKGDKEALNKMEEYNCGDTEILEETYLKIRPWIKPHPNMGLFILDETQSHCPTCGHTDLKDEGKMYRTSAGNYELMRCNNCGASGRKRLSETNIKQKRHLILATAK